MTSESIDLGIPGVTLAHRIGSGGNAIVYRARQPELDRAVVVKVLMVGDAEVTQRRFDRERRAMGRLSQAQGIAPVYDSGFTGTGQPYLIMPFYEHGSLQDRIEVSGPIVADEVRRIGVEIADAVQTAHDNGVLHRDLKPANILVTRAGRADVADFGIAQILDDSGGRSQAITMTPLYTAPEIFDGASPSRSSDVYSLGALLYALLNGRPAHADTSGSASVLALMMRIKDQPLPALPETVPADLVSLVAKAMHKDARKRYASASELAVALRAADLTPPRRSRRARNASRTVSAPTPPHNVPAPPNESEGRARLLKGLGVAVLVVGAALGTFVGLRLIGGDDPPADVVQVPVVIPSDPAAEPISEPAASPAEIGVDVAEIQIEAYSCGGVERSKGVLAGRDLVLTSQTIGERPWHVAAIVDGVSIPATVVSFDDTLNLASVQLDDVDDQAASPRLGRAVDGAIVHVRGPDGTLVEGLLVELPDGKFGLNSPASTLETGSAVVNSSGSLVGVVNVASPPQLVPVVGDVVQGWVPTAADGTCTDRGAAMGTAEVDQVSSPHLRELLQLQQLSEALAAEDWQAVREIEPAKSNLTDEAFENGWSPLEQSFLYPVERDEIDAKQVRWRLGLIGHERWDDEELTTLFCVWWQVDPETGIVIQTNENTERVFGSQAGERRRLGWVDPGSLLGEVANNC